MGIHSNLSEYKRDGTNIGYTANCLVHCTGYVLKPKPTLYISDFSKRQLAFISMHLRGGIIKFF